MKLGSKKLDQVYFMAYPLGTFEETFETKEEALRRIEELKTSNRLLTENSFYGDIVNLGKFISYTSYSLVPVSEDLDLAYAEAKNMTELKKKFKEELKGKKDARVVTFKDGLISSVSKKVTTKKVLFVEELASGPLEEDIVVSSFIKDGMTNEELKKYNSLPDTKYIYKKEYYATDYETNTILYNVRVFRVLERATTLEEIDKKITQIQNEYMAREKYGVLDSSTLRVLRIPEFKELEAFYKEDKHYLSARDLISFYDARTTDLTLLHTLLDDSYTNMKGGTIPEEDVSKDKEDMTRKEKIAKLKRRLKSEVSIYEGLLEQPKSFERDRNIEMQKSDIGASIHPLLFNIIYRNLKKHDINYSLLRHLATILKKRNEEIERLSDNYMDELVKSFEELEPGILEQESNGFKLF